VKRIAVLGLVAAVALACSGSEFLAQGQIPSSTSVAIVNIGQVFATYKKAIAYKGEMDVMLDPYRKQGKKLSDDLEAFQKALKDPMTKAELKPSYQKAVVDLSRALEDLERETKLKVGKTQEEHIVGLFRDVNEAVKAYATAHGINLVMAYGEQLDGNLFNFANINRIMSGMDLGVAHPLYFHPSADITTAVADVLNQGYRPVPAAATSNPKK
jgi:Skp family chaperone for outer membrane proteins